MTSWSDHIEQLEHFREQIDQTHENFELAYETIEYAAKAKREHAEQLEQLVERMDDMNQHDDNSTAFLMRLQEAINNEAELTRNTLSDGLSIIAEDLKKHKDKSLSSVKALKEKAFIVKFNSKYAADSDKVCIKTLCKQLEEVYSADMKFMSDVAGRYLRVQETFHQGIVTAECYGELSELSECDPGHSVQAALQTMPTVQKRKMSNRRRSSVIDTKDDLKEQFRRASLLQQDEIIAEPTFKKPLDQRRPSITQLAQQLHGFENNTLQKDIPSMYLTMSNFDGTQLQEFHALSVGKGEILTRIEPISNEVTQIVNGWSKVKNQRGSIGFVPTPLLKQLEHSS